MKRNYPLLLVSQFLSAFGDQAILAIILGQLTFAQQAGRITEGALSSLNALYSSLLFIPYILLAPLVGYLNDRHAKTWGLAAGNLIKLGGTLIALASLWGGAFWQGLGYFVVGVGACVYSPGKYGILPEIIDRERLVKANGTLEFLTIAAILTGFIGGAALVDRLPVAYCYAILMVIYGLSLLLNLLMTTTPAHPEIRLGDSLGEFKLNFGELLASPRLRRVLCGLGLFWLCAAALKMNFQPWGLNVLELQAGRLTLLGQTFALGVNVQIALLGLWLSVGVMAGSMLAGQLHRVGDLRGLRPYGWGLAGFIALLGGVEFGRQSGWFGGSLVVIGLLIATGLVGGLFLIPMNAALQHEGNQARLGKTIAAMNLTDNLGMVIGGGLLIAAPGLGIHASGVFFLLAGLLAVIVSVLKVPGKVRAEATANPGSH